MKKAPLVEIITGKGSGQLKKHVLRLLDQPEVEALYDRVGRTDTKIGRGPGQTDRAALLAISPFRCIR